MKRSLWPLGFFLFLGVTTSAYPQFDKAVDGRINREQPLFAGQTVYTVIKDGSLYNNGRAYYYVETIEYSYYTLQRNRLIFLVKYSYSDESMAPDKKYKVDELVLPLDDQKQALLTAEDENQLTISVLDDGSIKVAEVQTDIFDGLNYLR